MCEVRGEWLAASSQTIGGCEREVEVGRPPGDSDSRLRSHISCGMRRFLESCGTVHLQKRAGKPKLRGSLSGSPSDQIRCRG